MSPHFPNGTIEDYHDRYTKTDIGKACIMNCITEIDIFTHEESMQHQVDAYWGSTAKISTPDQLLDAINYLFVQHLSETDSDNLRRLMHKEARKFYAMMFAWRVENKSYSEMIRLFVGYWYQLYKQNHQVLVYVS